MLSSGHTYQLAQGTFYTRSAPAPPDGEFSLLVQLHHCTVASYAYETNRLLITRSIYN